MGIAEIWKRSEEILPWLIEVRRDFHQHPELGMEEFRTKDQIIRCLEEMDIPYEVVASTGIVGFIQGGLDGKTVALRGDMDALPISEQNEVSYKSATQGKMHACGHDAHMTVLLGAAKILQERKASLPGNVKLFFQPAEETVGGAEPMIAAGVMENPHVDAVFGLHVDPSLPTGKISVKYGQMYASSDTLRIVVRGENAHGAYPHMGRDAIVIAAQVINALQTIVSRNVDPRQAAVVTLGMIQGGTAGNILADEVHLTGTIRTLDKQVRGMVKERVKEVASSVANALGGEAEVSIIPSYPSLINHGAMVDRVRRAGEQLLGAEHVQVKEFANMGVEDFAFFAEKAPAAFYNLGCRNEETGVIYPVHHPRFNIDERCLQIGTAMQVQNAISYLHDEKVEY